MNGGKENNVQVSTSSQRKCKYSEACAMTRLKMYTKTNHSCKNSIAGSIF